MATRRVSGPSASFRPAGIKHVSGVATRVDRRPSARTARRRTLTLPSGPLRPPWRPGDGSTRHEAGSRSSSTPRLGSPNDPASLLHPRNLRRPLGVHILPILGDVRLDRLTPSEVRRWHRERSEGPSPSMAPKAYRLLRTILTTAVDDELIARNPCRIRSAGVDRSTAQQVVSIPQLYAIADCDRAPLPSPGARRGLAGLRAGELFALTRADIDLEEDGRREQARHGRREQATCPPRLRGGPRDVAQDRRRPPECGSPHVLIAELEAHLANFVGRSATDLVFTGALGAPLDRTNFRDRCWKPATAAAGVPSLRLHDLRHTAATLAATTGASTKELMARLGHASPALRSSTSTPLVIAMWPSPTPCRTSSSAPGRPIVDE